MEPVTICFLTGASNLILIYMYTYTDVYLQVCILLYVYIEMSMLTDLLLYQRAMVNCQMHWLCHFNNHIYDKLHLLCD